MRCAIAVAAILIGAGVARAGEAVGSEADAERALNAADRRAAATDPAAIDAYEAVGALVPPTRWTGVAWAQAARLAEQAGNFARARADLERVIAAGGDGRRIERARADLARLTAATGGGRWDRVAAEHDRLAALLAEGDDPKPALVPLEALVVANPGYPRAVAAVLEVADRWERDGNAEHATEWLIARRADLAAGGPLRGDGSLETPRSQLTVALIRVLIHRGELADAEAELAAYEVLPRADRMILGELHDALGKAMRRHVLRLALWLCVLVIAGLAISLLVRDPRGWRVALRRLIRPPIEVVFLVPIAVVLIGVAATGNPMVARAVRQIVIGGLAVAWLSGALLDGQRAARGRIGAGRAVAHAVAAVVAVGAIAYLSLDHDRMLDLVAETWRAGPQMR